MPARPRVDRLKIIYTAAGCLNYGWRMSDYPSTPFNNGVTRYIPQLHRVTIRFCRKNEDSAGVRCFISNRLKQFASENPSVAVYVQPVRQNIPLLRAEYANGRIIQVVAKNFSEDEVERNLNMLRTRSGLPVVNLVSRQTASVPSIQGMWSPVRNIPTELNISEFPCQKYSRHRTAKPSATEYIASLAGENISEAR